MMCKFKAKSLLLYDDDDDDADAAADDGGDDDGVPTFMSVGRDYSIAQGKPVFATVFTKMGLVGYLYLYSIKSLLLSDVMLLWFFLTCLVIFVLLVI